MRFSPGVMAATVNFGYRAQSLNSYSKIQAGGLISAEKTRPVSELRKNLQIINYGATRN